MLKFLNFIFNSTLKTLFKMKKIQTNNQKLKYNSFVVFFFPRLPLFYYTLDLYFSNSFTTSNFYIFTEELFLLFSYCSLG